MTTAQNARNKAAKDTTNPVANAFAEYLDTLTNQHETFVSSLKGSRARAQRMSTELSDALIAGQRDMLGISRQVLDHPADFSAAAKLVMDAATAAQERALKFGKLVCEEQVEAGAEAQKMWAGTVGATGFGTSIRPFAGWFAKTA